MSAARSLSGQPKGSQMDPALLEIRRERMRILADWLAEETGIPASSILGRSHDAMAVAVRHRLWRIMRDSGLSINAVSMVVGRHHTSVMYALRTP